MALIPRNVTSTIAYLLALFAAVLTATYSARLMIMTFFGEPHFPKTILNIIHDPASFMYIPLFILGLGAAFFGFLAQDIFLGAGSTFYLQA
jgi:NADH:ubiquinone oxidoreductase subunit 5 (subunit L)/multisubunit Na+/H+ antiporter MnhA subunit